MRDVGDHLGVGLSIVFIVFHILTHGRVEVLHGVARLRACALDVPHHIDGYEVLSRMEIWSCVYVEIAEHTDVGSGLMSVDIHFGHFGDGVEVKLEFLALDVSRELYPLAIPCAFRLSVVECIVLAAVGLFLIISV